MEYNTVKPMGKGLKVLFTNKDLDLTVKGNRGFISFDLNAKDLGQTESGRTYKGQVNRQKVQLGKRTYVINMYVVEIVDEAEAPKPKAKATKKLVM
jgi:hypothetical protein